MDQSANSIAIALGSPHLQVCLVSIKNYTAETIDVDYRGLPGNQPHTYQNFVAIWEATVIPWVAAPIKKIPIMHTGQGGTIALDELTIARTSYTIGYGVGNEIPTICASAQLDAGGLRAAPTSVQIGVNYVGSHSLTIHYRTLSGYLPHRYNNWIGLWKGYVSPYHAPEPLGSVNIGKDQSEGYVGINNVTMGINTTYSLIYFMGRQPTEAAAILTFDTADIV